MATPQARQLALNVQLRDDATLDNFLAPQRLLPLLHELRDQVAAGGEPAIYIYGPKDTGKSHLLQGSCHLMGNDGLYLPLAELVSYSPDEVLQGMESMGMVCLDDIEVVLGNAAWELALFNFFNRARESGCRLLMSGAAAPRELAVDLADLQSRLSWGVVYQLPPASDEDKIDILVYRAARRCLQMSPEVAGYIINRAPRSLGQLLPLLAQLDVASLAEQRSLSIPFVKRQLGW